MSYVVKVDMMDGYIRARDEYDDWTITFDQRRAMRFESLVDAELVAVDFGAARPVKLRRK